MRVSQLIHVMDKDDLIIVEDGSKRVTNMRVFKGKVRWIKKDNPINRYHVHHILADGDTIVVLAENQRAQTKGSGSMNAPKLIPCPQCGETPTIGYACGEFFIRTSKPVGACFCGSFTEMHSCPGREAEAWNSHAQEAHEVVRCAAGLAPPDIHKNAFAALDIPPDLLSDPPSKE